MKRCPLVRAVGLAFLCPLLSLPLEAQEQWSFPLQRQAEEILRQAGGEWGVFAWSIDRDEPLFAINHGAALVPASNNKIITAVWALDLLGAEHRFATDMLVSGEIENGVLRGDVVLRGSGDPAFGYPPRTGFSHFVEDPMTPLRTMAARLRERGVRVVEGGVVGDATVFDDLLVGPEWPADTGGGAAQYAPRVSGLAFQRNMIWVEARPNPNGGPPVIELSPPVEVVPVVSTLSVGGGGAMAVRRAQEDTVRLRGSISGRLLNRYGIGVADPALMAADALRQALIEAGIEVRGAARTGPTPEGATIVHRRYSMPLGDMIPFLNRNSDNFFAEHLWKVAAHAAIGEGSYTRGGPASALHFIQHAGVPAGELYQFDGSGLSRLSRMSANSLVRALVHAHHQPYSELFHRSMAVAADPSGTMNRMFVGSAAGRNLHAKTGFIRNVRTLSGYVTAANGELIAFSFLYNGGNTNGARTVQERLGILLAEYGAGSAPAAPQAETDS
jgi:serine-type D-Ala-D-Ala carboxypeptidase/endopeptidase (penicillin-binding protein 4)